jgi:hypothetical protein
MSLSALRQSADKSMKDGNFAEAFFHLTHAIKFAPDGSSDKSDLYFQGRDSPIVKHYPQIKNPCFVTCVNFALCS